jgi:ion channel-forming bestrophin family protein
MLAAHRWLVIPAAVTIALVFGLIERTDWVIENPFENTINDVPLSAYTTTIERDLLELLGETTRPSQPAPVAGYLF